MSRPTGVGRHGLFADDVKGATPLHAINQGLRRDEMHRDTLAKLFVQVSPGERDAFMRSIGDVFTQTKLAPRVTGLQALDESAPAPTPNAEQRSQAASAATGYVDFFIQSAVHAFRENYQVAPTLEGNYVVYSFDQEPPVFPYSGVLVTTRQDDQAVNLYRLYVHIIRLAQLAKRQKTVSLRYGSYIVHGAMVNLQLAHGAETQTKADFNFQLLVKQVYVVNYTQNWHPTVPASDFSDDPNVAASEPVVRARTTTAITATVPINTELAPGPEGEPADERVVSTPPAPSGEPLACEPEPAPAPPEVRAAPRPETVNRPGGHAVSED